MHLLAHALLARISLVKAASVHRNSSSLPNAVTGALMADFFAGQEIQQYPPAVRQAILQHRAIDEFTDTHAEFITLRRRIAAAGAPRFSSGILADIFWGHSLAAGWDEFAEPLCGLSLPQFCRLVADGITATRSVHSPAFAHAAGWMVAHNWLERLSRRSGILQSLQGLSRRLTRAESLPDSIAILDTDARAIHAGFRRFWPEAVEFAMNWPHESDAQHTGCARPVWPRTERYPHP
ncbi:MAG: ACP phosphodiesterase [Spirochaeta sp.]